MLSFRSKLIFDFDDAISVKQIMLSSKPEPASRLKLRRIACTLSKASLVFAGSDDLKTYAERYNRNVHLVPTSCSIQQKAPGAASSGCGQVTIGRIGTNSNHYYLGIIDKALNKLRKAYPFLSYDRQASVKSRYGVGIDRMVIRKRAGMALAHRYRHNAPYR